MYMHTHTYASIYTYIPYACMHTRRHTHAHTLILREVCSEVALRIHDLAPEEIHFVQKQDLHTHTSYTQADTVH